jgi:integrase
MPKTTLPLNDKQVSAAKHKPVANAQTGKLSTVTRLFDGGGLYLEVSATSKLWRLKYMHNGKECRMSLGSYPPVTLADAREAARTQRALVAKGVKPVDHKREVRAANIEASSNTFEAVARLWLAKEMKTWKESHGSRVVMRMEKYVFPRIGGTAIRDVTKKAVIDAVEQIAGRNGAETSHRVLSNICQVFRYADVKGLIDRIPVDSVAIRKEVLPTPKKKHLAALTKPDDVARLLRAAYAYRGSLAVNAALKLSLLTVVRPGELRHMEWSEIDLDKAQMIISADKMKMDADHIVPLSTQAVEVLRELQPYTGRGRYVFPSARTPNGSRPMSNNAILAALRSMEFSTEEMSGHGVRAIFRTLGDEVLGMRVEWLEMQLAHTVKDVHGNAYNRTQFLTQRTDMMQRWADYLQSLRTGEPLPEDSNVLTFKRSA